ncbi:MAG: HD domain-containing protein [Dehalococcoidales bacterium]|nr:HD domain-containing protein [Dehalococcoidales bacterium]
MNNLSSTREKAALMQIDNIPGLKYNSSLNGSSLIDNLANVHKMNDDAKTESGSSAYLKIFDDIINAMVAMIEVRDRYTAVHQRKVACISVEIAKIMDLPVNQIKGLQLAALIHDIGKLAIPNEILSKPGRLSHSEYELIKTHPSTGFAILRDIDFPWPIAQIVLQHHERINGSGYPSHLSKYDILLEAKILAVADVMEAMASDRPYRPCLGIEPALEEITKNKHVLYDGNVVDACLELCRKKELMDTMLS